MSNDPRNALAQASKDAMLQRQSLKQATSPPPNRGSYENLNSSTNQNATPAPNPATKSTTAPTSITITKSATEPSSSPSRTPRSRPGKTTIGPDPTPTPAPAPVTSTPPQNTTAQSTPTKQVATPTQQPRSATMQPTTNNNLNQSQPQSQGSSQNPMRTTTNSIPIKPASSPAQANTPTSSPPASASPSTVNNPPNKPPPPSPPTKSPASPPPTNSPPTNSPRSPTTSPQVSPRTATSPTPAPTNTTATPAPAPAPTSAPAPTPAPAPAQKAAVICDRCEEKSATLRCSECGKPYCNDCNVEVHSRGKWSTHTTYPVDGQAPQNRPPSNTTTATTAPANGTAAPNKAALPGARPGQRSVINSQPQTAPARTASLTQSQVAPPKAPSQIPTRPVTMVDTTKEAEKLTSLKEQALDEVIDSLMSASFVYLCNGVFLKEEGTNVTLFCRLNDEQTKFEFCKVNNPATFEKGPKAPMPDVQSINTAELEEITEIRNTKLPTLNLKTKSNISKTLVSESRTEFVHILDGLRCLIGLEMQSSEMQSSISALTEMKALLQVYVPPPAPAKPNNYNFAT